MAAAIVISLIAWYFCKRRRTGDVHFSVLFEISLSKSKRRKCLKLFYMSAGGGGANANCRFFPHLYMASSL